MPDVPDTLASADAVAQVVAVVRAALAAEAGRVAPVDGLGAVDESAFLQAVRLHRVAGVIAESARAIGLPAELAAAVRPFAREDAALGLTLADRTRRAALTMAGAGIPVLVMKGCVLSAQTTGSLTLRGGGDIDLLVRPDDVARAHTALVAAGWDAHEASPPTPGPVWSWTSHMRREYLFTGPPGELDLHWRVGLHHRPLPAASVLLARAATVDVDGVPVRTLAPSAACLHVHLDRYARLRSLVDIVRLVRRPDVRMPVDAGAQWRRLVGDVVAFAGDLLGGVPPERLRELCGSSSVPVERQRALWERACVRPIWSNDVLPIRDLLPVYAERGRYSGYGPAALMMASDFVLPPERLHPGMSAADVARAVAAEARDFVDRRLRHH